MISTRGRYALRVMIDLAEHKDEGFIPMKDVVARQEISKKYMEQIMPSLVKSGFVEGVHGKGGGYKLTREPAEYTAGRYCVPPRAILRLLPAFRVMRRNVREGHSAKPCRCGKNLTI